jgi:hypothetical protein
VSDVHIVVISSMHKEQTVWFIRKLVHILENRAVNVGLPRKRLINTKFINNYTGIVAEMIDNSVCVCAGYSMYICTYIRVRTSKHISKCILYMHSHMHGSIHTQK